MHKKHVVGLILSAVSCVIVVFLYLFISMDYLKADKDLVNIKYSHTLDSLLNVLDGELAYADTYKQNRQQQIDSLKQQLLFSSFREGKEAVAEVSKEIFYLYRQFQSDSAIVYGHITLDASQENTPKYNDFKLDLISLYISLSMYAESRELIGQMNPKKLPKDIQKKYYKAKGYLYGEIAAYTKDSRISSKYYGLAYEVKHDSLLPLLDNASFEKMSLVEDLVWFYDPAYAITINDSLVSMIDETDYRYAFEYFMRGLAFAKIGKQDESLIAFTKSALSDLSLGVADNGSIWTIARELFAGGDIKRAYKYVNYSMDNAKFYNSPLRHSQLSVSLGVIEKQYQAGLEQRNQKLSEYGYVATFLAIMAMCSLVVCIALLHKISKARLNLSNNNKQLEQLNYELNWLNSNLKESNEVKELYLNQYILMSMSYVERIEQYRKQVRKRLITKNYSELLDFVNSTELSDQDIDEFYANFDKAFLNLYPDFISEFNKLLEEDARFVLKQNNTLCTELRIYALIRLGVTESSKIANFLRYSVNSIYNYRSKIKSKALGDKNEFDNEVQKIGKL